MSLYSWECTDAVFKENRLGIWCGVVKFVMLIGGILDAFPGGGIAPGCLYDILVIFGECIAAIVEGKGSFVTVPSADKKRVISGTASPNPEGEEMAMPSDKPSADWVGVES